MIVVVDSSVAVKWFLAEPDHDQAIALSKAAEAIYAPELLIAEVTNVVWKEAARKRILPEQAKAIAAQLTRSPVNFVPISALHERALGIATEINHSVYDCLFLACAEKLGAHLITADEKFLNKTRNSTHSNFMKALGDKQVTRGVLPAPIHLSRETIEEIVRIAELFRSTHRNVLEQLTRGNPLQIYSTRDSQVAFRSPSYRRLEKIYASLSRDERIDFLALGWFGKEIGRSNWVELRRHADLHLGDESPDNIRYNLSQALHLRRALDKLDGKD